MTAATADAGAPTRFARGWVIVFAAFTVLFTAYGLQFSFGVFVKAIEDDLGWTRAQLSIPYAVYVFLYSALSAVSGIVTDRKGPRVAILVGGILLGSGYVLFGLAQELWQVYLVFGIVAACGMSSAWVPCSATVVRWFVRRRGLAYGIASTGGAFGNIVVPPITATLIASIGWRSTLIVSGIAGAAILVTMSVLMIRDPEQVGLHPDGDPAPVTTSGVVDLGPAYTAQEARRTTAFWALFGIFLLNWLVVFVPFVHGASFAQDLGATTRTSAFVISFIGVGGVIGRLSAGAASDRLGRRTTLAVMMALQVVSFLGWAVGNSWTFLLPVAVLFGLSYGGGTTLFPAIIGDLFGRAHAGAIVGSIFATAGALAAIGPFLAGVLYDATQSYRLAFVLCAACNLGAMILVFTLRNPAPPTTAVTAP